MEFKNYKVFKYTYAGRPLVIETGKMAGLANGSVLTVEMMAKMMPKAGTVSRLLDEMKNKNQ